MTTHHRPVRTALGATLLLLGVAGWALLLVQPWLSCPDDTTSAACPVPDALQAVTLAAWLACSAAAAAGLVTLVRRPRRTGT